VTVSDLRTSPVLAPVEPSAIAAPGELLAIEPLTEDAAARRGFGVLFWLAVGAVGVMILLAILAPILPLRDPTALDYRAVNIGPSWHHWLGTDDLGRDLLSRVIWGSRVSLIIGFGSVFLGLLTGGSAGMLAAYRGRGADGVLNAFSFVLLAFPPILAIMVIEAFWGKTLLKLTLLFALVAAPQLFRVVRASTLSVANREFVLAARTMGATTNRIIFRELLPNVLPAAISFALIGVAIAIVVEGSLAFLGLSISLPTASLGNIINEGAQLYNLQTNPWPVVFPSLYIFVLIVSLNFIGDRLRGTYDSREAKL
jgi:peptide/nickel transport system permease protein